MQTSKLIYKIHPIPVLKDNIIWVLACNGQAVVVDPAISSPVKNFLKNKGLDLIAILQTHHHDDHIGGTKGLLEDWPKAEVVASEEDLVRIPFQTVSVKHGTRFSIMKQKIEVIGVSGHTRHHLAYYLPTNDPKENKPAVFCGDTLFGAGCGRLFEGTPNDMYKALNLLNSLPGETRIYCAHEYTENNLIWANYLYPEDILIKERLKSVSIKREKGLLSLPSTLSEERQTNLFLRAKDVSELAALRKNKDQWST